MKKVAALSIVFLLLVVTGFIMYRQVLQKNLSSNIITGTTEASSVKQSSTGNTDITDAATESDMPGANASAAVDGAESKQEALLFNLEEIPVSNPSPEYELQLQLIEDAGKNVFLRAYYYFDGSRVVRNLGIDVLPELTDIFARRSLSEDRQNAYRVVNATLNTSYGRLYFFINGDGSNGMLFNSFYSVELANGKTTLISEGAGNYGKLLQNKTGKYLAYSYEDPPQSSALQEACLLCILDASDNRYLVKDSRGIDGKKIGANISKDIVYDYRLISFRSGTSVRLLRTGILLDSTASKSAGKSKKSIDNAETEVIYDFNKNLFYDKNGNVILQDNAASSGAGGTNTSSSNTNTSGGTNNKDSTNNKDITNNKDVTNNKDGTNNTVGNGITSAGNSETEPSVASPVSEATDSEALKTLKQFYKYLSNEADYQKAMDMLDKEFKFKMYILQQFGVTELTKGDINTEQASIYSNLLMAAKFDEAGKEETKDGITTIYYFQTMEMTKDNLTRMPMVAKLIKSGKTYKLLLLQDG